MAKPRPNNSLSHAMVLARRKYAKKSLARYMRTNFDELTQEIGSRADWALLVIVFNCLDLKDAKGNAPTQSVARQTWHRIRKAVMQERAEASVPVTAVKFKPPHFPQFTQGTGVALPPSPVRTAIPPEPHADSGNDTESKVSAALAQILGRKIPMPRKIDDT